MALGGKIEKVYWAAKGLLIFSAAGWVFLRPVAGRWNDRLLVLLAIYLVVNAAIWWLCARHLRKTKTLLFGAFVIDTLFLSSAIFSDGGAQSQLYIGYYVLVALLSVYFSTRQVAIVAFIFSLSYIGASLALYQKHYLLTVLFRAFYIWLLGGIGYTVAYYMRASEKRVLKTLDILNERTWELESSQAQLENVYETTKALSSILDMEHLLQEVLEIAAKLLRLKRCSVLLLESSDKNLYLHAELKNGKKVIYNPPLPASEITAADVADSSIAKSQSLLVKKRTSELELPLVSHGKLLGIVQIEAQQPGELREKDRRSLIVFANSAAIAIDNARLHQKMQELIIIDELTGLYNYRFFCHKLSDEMRRADRYHQPMSLLMIDIDHFKELNDAEGHQTGNIILQELAGVIKQAVRDVDIVARYGGEEFMVILPQTDSSNAQMIAERIRSQIERAYFSNSHGQRYLKVTVSIGVVTYPDGSLSASGLLEKVDEALYAAKRNGRNRVCVSSTMPVHQSSVEIG